ncbi:MAG: isopentenyl phosphate kinase [Halobacteriales archaeon]|nr:isopentenyl phosphate kinase [Halobacteriales archaeon]
MILKIGGSVLTDKSREETLSDSFDDAISTVAEADRDDLILVHGAGSFGHPHAQRNGLSDGGHEGTYETHEAVARLNRRVVSALNERGTDALPVHPLSCAWRDGTLGFETVPARRLRAEGFLPVLHGDVIADTGSGVSVLSGDDIAVELAEQEGEEIGMCTSAGGILDEDGERLERVSTVEEVAVFESDGADVTGGIRGKVESILSLPEGGRVFGADELDEYLDGKAVGTLVRRRRE